MLSKKLLMVRNMFIQKYVNVKQRNKHTKIYNKAQRGRVILENRVLLGKKRQVVKSNT